MRVFPSNRLRLRCGARVLGMLLALAASTPALADMPDIPEVDYPQIVAQAATVEGFVPAGWRVEQRLDGDLDRDGRGDVVLLLRMDDPANVLVDEDRPDQPLDTNPRMLVAALSVADGSWRRVVQDHALIPRDRSPYQDDYLGETGGVTLAKNGILSVTLHNFSSWGSWEAGTATLTFRHQDGCMRLIGYDRYSLQRNTGEIRQSSVNLLTARGWISTSSISDDGDPPKQWRRLPKRPPTCLEQVGDGFLFDAGLNARD